MLSFKLKTEQGEEKVISSPDDLRSVQLVINPTERIIQKAVFMETHEFTNRELLRFYTLLDLVKHKQDLGGDVFSISKAYSQVSVVYSSKSGTLYFFKDDGFSGKLTGRVKDLFFFRQTVEIPAGKKPLIEPFRRNFENALEKIKNQNAQRRARNLLEDEEFLDAYDRFWDNVITVYSRVQNDMVYNFLLNVFRKYALY